MALNKLKIRSLLVSIHLYLASFLAPVFILLAFTGGLYLFGIERPVEKTTVAVLENYQVDPNRPDLEEHVAEILEDNGINLEFEYIRARSSSLTTRPTTRTFAVIKQTDNGAELSVNEPGLQYTLMELHKGHGPRIFRTYQMIAGLVLCLVVIGGFAVGVMAPGYRKQTLIVSAVGLGFFGIMAF